MSDQINWLDFEMKKIETEEERSAYLKQYEELNFKIKSAYKKSNLENKDDAEILSLDQLITLLQNIKNEVGGDIKILYSCYDPRFQVEADKSDGEFMLFLDQ